MIGTSREILLYTALTPAWYKPLGLTIKRAYKLKCKIIAGLLGDKRSCELLAGLGYKKVRNAHRLAATYRKGDIVVDEQQIVGMSGNHFYHWQRSEKVITDLAQQLGFVLEQPRVLLPSIWEKPCNVCDRAYTKADVVAGLVFDQSEI